MLECFSRILGQKPWLQYLGARCRRTRICSVFPCQTALCRECSTLLWGSVLRCQHCAGRRGPVESSTYHLLALLLETRRQHGSCRGLLSTETHQVWERALCPPRVRSELRLLERSPYVACRSSQ